jgi:ferrous iron transport protein A
LLIELDDTAGLPRNRGYPWSAEAMLMTSQPQAGVPLGQAARGFRGRIRALLVEGMPAQEAAELERRLVELGFIEGAYVEVLHEGPLGHDPIAVRVNNATVALRRREAMAILVNRTGLHQ